MRLVFLYGLPAAGKYTIACELAKQTGYRLFHNHLVVDMLLPVFEFGSEPFVALREDIWLAVFEEALGAEIEGLIFTFAPESTVGPGFPEQVRDLMEEGGGTVDFVEVTAPLAQLKKRMNAESRRQHGKLTSVAMFEDLHAKGVFAATHMPKARISVDTSRYEPSQAAAWIVQELRLSATQQNAANT